MSSIQKVAKAGGKSGWRARYRTPDGSSREKWFERRADAERFLTATDHRKIVGEYVDPSASKITFAAYSAGWLTRRRATVKPSTAETYAAHLNRHLLPTFGSRQLASITREEVKTFAASLGTKVAPTTARGIVFQLAAVLREAVDDNRIVKNPAERIRVGAKTERRVDPMHIAQVAAKVPAIASAVPPRWRAAVLLMATTGLRLGECLGLTTDRVDFLGRKNDGDDVRRYSIRVDRQLVSTPEGSRFGTTKTRAGVRVIPVPKLVVDMLAEHLATFPANADGLVFTMDSGRPVARTRWADRYRAACAVAALDGRTRTHDLRHVAASSLIASGLSVAAVQAVLGHSSASETLEVYTHLWPSDEDRTRIAIAAASAAWLNAV